MTEGTASERSKEDLVNCEATVLYNRNSEAVHQEQSSDVEKHPRLSRSKQVIGQLIFIASLRQVKHLSSESASSQLFKIEANI